MSIAEKGFITLNRSGALIERLNFDNMGYCSLESSIHVARYQLAKQLVKGKSVLDIACGEGYGSWLLKEWGASEVTAVDISTEAIASAKNNFFDPKINFLCGAAENLNLDKKFDVIISLETIEHVNNESEYLETLKNLLDENGALIISCPNDYWYFNDMENNPFHLRKYHFEDFQYSTEKTLGQAKAWVLSGHVFGYANLLYNPTEDRLEIQTSNLNMKHIIDQNEADCLISRQDTQYLPDKQNSLYYAGIWSNNEVITSPLIGANIFPVKPLKHDIRSVDVYIESLNAQLIALREQNNTIIERLNRYKKLKNILPKSIRTVLAKLYRKISNP